MFYPQLRPRITNYVNIKSLVDHLRKEGIDDKQIPQRITEIGAIDLDMLDYVLRVG